MKGSNTGPRTGVFLCTCNGTVSITLDMKKLADDVRDIDGAQYVEVMDFLCHKGEREHISSKIKKERLDRVVIAACSPLLYLKEFEAAGVGAGLASNMVELTNIREQCSWIHSGDREEATRKALDLITMTAAKLSVAVPQEEGTRAIIKEEACSGCGVCQATCRVNAIKMVDIPEKPGHRVARVIPAVCEGCGACVAACPSAAMDQVRFSNLEISMEIDAMTPSVNSLRENFPNILVFTCHWCSYTAGDKAGLKRLQMPPHFRTIRTMCSSRVDPEWVMRALSRGVDGVLILAGKPGRCHYEVGSIRTNRRMALLKGVVQQLGFDDSRFKTIFVDSDEPELYQKLIEDFVIRIKAVGPNPMRIPEPLEPQTVPYQFQGVSDAQMKARGLL